MPRPLLMTFLALAVWLVGNAPGPLQAAALQRRVPDKAGVPALQTTAPTGRLIVKFTEASGLVVRDHGLAGGDPATRSRVLGLLADKAGSAPLTRRFPQRPTWLDSLRQTGQAKAALALPDLNAYGVLDYSGGGLDRDGLLAVLKPLLADPAVETAFLEPKAVPAALGFDAFTGVFTPPGGEDSAPVFSTDSRATPDYQGSQGYLGAPPAGINALAASPLAGGRGQNLTVVDIELGWNFGHEDLPAPFWTAGNLTSILDNRNHGTAVLGEIRGQDNGLGVRGIAPDARIGASSAYGVSTAAAITAAWQAISTGDVLLIELHAPGPAANGDGQFGYLPMEYWQDNFDAILTVTANGGVVCEAAGNGTQDLDAPLYGSVFDRNWRDSGAIMCGAATSLGIPYVWSNHGSRLDLNGWGGNVVSCGYGDLQGSPDFTENQYYTASFSGTSSASPIVTGAVLALQGLAKETYGTTLDALTLREVLVETGTPQGAGSLVGPRPDILAAFNNLQWGLGEISGTVTDAGTGLPIAGVEVLLSGSDQIVTTDDLGRYHLIAPVGWQDLMFRQFFYHLATGSREIAFDTPAVLNLALQRLPAVDLRAVARTETGAPPTGCRATVLNAPLNPERLTAEGDFRVSGAPVGVPLQLRFDGVPGHGVDVVTLTPGTTPAVVYPQLAVVDHNFEFYDFGYTATSGLWTWGTPTAAPVPFSGTSCWGVGLAGPYPDGAADYLTSPTYNLFGHDQTTLSLHYWSDLEDGVDGACLQILGYNGVWVDLEPLGGYSHARVTTLGNKPGWSGNSGGWQGAVFDITPYTDLLVRFRFKFFSDSSVGGAGFFIDDVTFDTGDSATPVGELPEAGPGVQVSAAPNPFNPATTIAWRVDRPGPLSVRVFDTRGQLVRVLLDEPVSATAGSLTWDGHDQLGRGAASGAYFIRVQDSSGQGATRRVTLLK